MVLIVIIIVVVVIVIVVVVVVVVVVAASFVELWLTVAVHAVAAVHGGRCGITP